MATFISKHLSLALVVAGLIGIIITKGQSVAASDTQLFSLTERGPTPVFAQRMFAGPAPGLAADVNILSSFSVYSHINRLESNAEHSAMWVYLANYLEQASILDPYFYDTYRLSSGLLAFQEQHAKEAIEIMKYGAQYRTWDWETPLIAGFLAHHLLQDNKLAFELMKLATSRPDAPPLAIGLAARFLADSEGRETGIQYLRYMKSIMPKGYSKHIDDRILEFEK